MNTSSNSNDLVDVLGDLYISAPNVVGSTQNTYNPKKLGTLSFALYFISFIMNLN